MNAKVLTLSGKNVLTGAVSKGGPLDKEGVDEAAAGAFSRGAVIQDYAIGDYPVYVTFGVIKIQISEIISDLSSEAELTPSGSGGKWKIGTTGNYIGAIALETGSADDYIDVLIVNPYVKENATTDEFTDFTDTPSAYTDDEGKLLAVNSSEDAVEFVYENERTAKTGDYTALLSDRYLELDGSSSTVTLTLPAAGSIEGKSFIVKATDLTNAVDIATNASETIDGVNGFTFNIANEVIEIVSDGTNWQILNHEKPVSNVTTYTAETPSASLSDDIILLDGTSNTVDMVLPAVSGNTGKIYEIKCINKDNAVKVSADGTENIGSTTEYTFTTVEDTIRIVCDGTQWQILNEYLNA